MKNIKGNKIIAGIVILFFVIACRHEILQNNTEINPGTPVPTSNCSPDTVYFANQIMPIISSNCTMSGCHDNITHADGVNLTSYTRIMRYVVAGNANESKLFKVIIKSDGDRMPPPPMPPLSSEQKALIQKWISQGAKNNTCIGSCDTTVFTYSGSVRPLIETKCIGCHNPANPGGNIDLSTYNAVKIVALNGKLYGSVAQLPGYSPMPKNSIKLIDCEIRQIQKWIAAGSQNN